MRRLIVFALLATTGTAVVALGAGCSKNNTGTGATGGGGGGRDAQSVARRVVQDVIDETPFTDDVRPDRQGNGWTYDYTYTYTYSGFSHSAHESFTGCQIKDVLVPAQLDRGVSVTFSQPCGDYAESADSTPPGSNPVEHRKFAGCTVSLTLLNGQAYVDSPVHCQ